MWSQYLDANGKWIEQKQHIAQNFRVRDNTLTKLDKDKVNSFSGRVLPARMALKFDILLKQMKCPDDVLTSKWDSFSKRRAHIASTCQALSSLTYPIHLPYDSTILSVYRNTFKKQNRKLFITITSKLLHLAM